MAEVGSWGGRDGGGAVGGGAAQFKEYGPGSQEGGRLPRGRLPRCRKLGGGGEGSGGREPAEASPLGRHGEIDLAAAQRAGPSVASSPVGTKQDTMPVSPEQE